MRILILGGSGFIGQALGLHLAEKGHTVYIGTRQTHLNYEAPLNAVHWTPESPAPLPNLDAIINLAGAPIHQLRWTKKVKSRIVTSRIETTKALATAIKTGFYTPKIVINGSAMGIYGDCGNKKLNEADAPIASSDFLAQVASAWELEALPIGAFSRLVLLRTAVVLGRGGALPIMAFPFKLGIGGPLGPGHQWLSWIHIQDLVNVIEYTLLNDSLQGPINACAPYPITQNEFSKVLSKTLHRPHLLRVPTPMLKLLVGEVSNVVLNSQRGSADYILSKGFHFQFPTLEDALENIYFINKTV